MHDSGVVSEVLCPTLWPRSSVECRNLEPDNGLPETRDEPSSRLLAQRRIDRVNERYRLTLHCTRYTQHSRPAKQCYARD
jgi:hypothetical protein